MKVVFTLALLLTAAFAFAAPVNKVKVNNGKWSTLNTWSLNKLPQSGDTVLIPAGYTLVIDANIKAGSTDLYIKVEGTLYFNTGQLNLGPNSTVTLVNQTAFIKVNSNVPANVIQIGVDKKYTGKEGALAGPLVANKTTGIAPMGFITPVVLPVKFIGFTVSNSGNGAAIQWSTAEEVDASVYEIERSEDGRNFKTIGVVAAVGNATNVNSYSYNDRMAVSKMTYYRLKQVDIDGRFTYTTVKTVTAAVAATQVKINATPYNRVVIEFSAPVKGTVQVQLVSLSGQVLAQQNFSKASGQVLFQTTSLHKGTYIVAVTDNQNLKVARQIML